MNLTNILNRFSFLWFKFLRLKILHITILICIKQTCVNNVSDPILLLDSTHFFNSTQSQINKEN